MAIEQLTFNLRLIFNLKVTHNLTPILLPHFFSCSLIPLLSPHLSILKIQDIRVDNRGLNDVTKHLSFNTAMHQKNSKAQNSTPAASNYCASFKLDQDEDVMRAEMCVPLSQSVCCCWSEGPCRLVS
uniref:Uncharacterized protein LOC111132695 n=1 Tax=Crassostrea virginica TaxID=6565 RepID=A0A8B8E991_CRAVI|nr:uncharacterized protein LOC111132695 [Crassostrea virginica]